MISLISFPYFSRAYIEKIGEPGEEASSSTSMVGRSGNHGRPHLIKILSMHGPQGEIQAFKRRSGGGGTSGNFGQTPD